MECSHHRLGRQVRGSAAKQLTDVWAAELALESVVPVQGARVAIANYGALLNDFPELRSPQFREMFAPHYCADCSRSKSSVCSEAVDAWIVRNAAFVSESQARTAIVNSPISHGAPARIGLRPPGYGRALVLPASIDDQSEPIGLFDVKGAGVRPGRTPSHADHSNGLEYLGVALSDFFYAHLIDKIFKRAAPSYSVLPVYAVLDLGFDVVDGWQGTAPAGLHVRRAHARGKTSHLLSFSGGDLERVQLHIELILRAFGMTSTNSCSSYTVGDSPDGRYLRFGTRPVVCNSAEERLRALELMEVAGRSRLELINIQVTEKYDWEHKQAELVDFGHFSSRRRFDFPIVTQAHDRFLGTGRIILPTDGGFAQPIKHLAVDADLCSRACVNAQSFYLAQGFRQGRYHKVDVERCLRASLVRAFGKRVVAAPPAQVRG